MLKTYRPECGQKRPKTKMHARLCYYGGGFIVDTPLELKGRGITKRESGRVGMNSYKVSKLAFDKLKTKHDISYAIDFD